LIKYFSSLSEAVKDSRKKIHLLKGNLEQAAYNLIAASCKLTEEVFTGVEKAREIAERKRIAALQIEREQSLIPYGVENVGVLNLGQMDADLWDSFLMGTIAKFEARKEAEAKAETERLENIRLDNLEAARRLEIAPFAQFIGGETDLRSKSEDDYQILLKSVRQADADYKEEQARIKAENDRLKAEAEEKRKSDEIEQAKRDAEAKKKQEEFDAKIKADKEKADAEAKELQAKLAKEQEEKKALQEAEYKRKAEAEAIEKDRIAAEKKAANAPDKIKLEEFAARLKNATLPEVKGEEAKKIMEESRLLLGKISAFILEKSANL